MEAKVIRNARYEEGTIVVEVTRTKIDQKYKKRIKFKKKFIVHNAQKTKIPVGARVEIVQCAPVSKRKYFRIESIIGGENI